VSTDASPLGAAGSHADGPIPFPNPYNGLANVLHDLYWLAAEVRLNKTRCFKQINPVTDPWDAYERQARQASISRGIPFTAFDPVLCQARQFLYELVQVAAENEGVPFFFPDARYTEIEQRLKDLGETFAGAGGQEQAEGAGRGQGGGEQSEGDSAGKLPPSRLKVLNQYRDALSKCPALNEAIDQDVYDWLKEHSDDDPLPSFANWSRYLREARKATGTNKNTPRSGRTGRSVVRSDEI
jgi:hypothetical protein